MAVSRKAWGAGGRVPRDGQRKTKLYIHHTVSPQGKRNRAQERAHMRQIDRTHRAQGWDTIGYSYILFPSGRLYTGRGANGLPAAQAGANSGSIAIACVGNYESDKLTRRQKARLILAARNLKGGKGIRWVGGHRSAPRAATACPGRNIQSWIPALAKRSGLKRL